MKVRQQLDPAEAIAPLVIDPFQVIECEAEAEVCEVEFDDETYTGEDRTVAYYVRAIQEETPSVNAQNLGCTMQEGKCVELEPCRASRDEENTCMGVAEERAWSSPIYLSPVKLASSDTP